MSQPPQHSPYSAPQMQPYPYDPYAAGYGYGGSDPLAPSRRASVLMFVLGGLLVLLGACNGVSGLFVDANEMMARNEQLFSTGQPSPLAPEMMRSLAIGFAVLTFAVGIAYIVLGTRVRAGSRLAIVTALVLSSLITLFLIAFALLSVLGAIVSPILLIVTCFVLIPLVLFGLQLIWLIQALRGMTPAALAQMQQQAAYWQYAQQQQAYQQSMYAYQQQQQQPPPAGDPSGNPPPAQP